MKYTHREKFIRYPNRFVEMKIFESFIREVLNNRGNNAFDVDLLLKYNNQCTIRGYFCIGCHI